MFLWSAPSQPPGCAVWEGGRQEESRPRRRKMGWHTGVIFRLMLTHAAPGWRTFCTAHWSSHSSIWAREPKGELSGSEGKCICDFARTARSPPWGLSHFAFLPADVGGSLMVKAASVLHVGLCTLLAQAPLH